MPSEIYEIISLAARYWFTFLGVLIVWRSFRWLRKDRWAKHRRLKQLPDAGMVGELVVLTGSEELPAGVALPLPREGVLGSLRTCDVTVPVTGVASRHLDFTFEDGLGLLIFPRTHATALVDGQEITSRTRSKDYPMHHGSRLTVGNAVLRLRLFVGLETAHPTAAVQPEEPPEVPAEEAPPAAMDWQNMPYIYHQIPAAWVDQTGQYQPIQVAGTGIDPQTGLPWAHPVPPSSERVPLEIDPVTGYAYPADPRDAQVFPPDDAAQEMTPIPGEPLSWSQEETLTDSLPEEEETFAYASARDRRKLFARRRLHGKK